MAHGLRQTYGSPLSRQRLYLILIQEAVLVDEARGEDEFVAFIQKKLKSMHSKSSTVDWPLAQTKE